MKIKFFTATAKEDISDTLIIKSNIRFCDLDYKGENKEPLSKVYNKMIERYQYEGYEYLILLHDDVHVNCSDFEERLEKAFDKFDIVGLAGSTECNFGHHNKPMLWHLISDRKNQLGCVAHGSKEDYFYTSFGRLNKQALLIDGVFIGINLKTIGDVRFDECNPASFHFYDLIFSLDANLKNKKVGVIDLPIIHSSPGLREFTDEWKSGEKYFKEKYKQFTGKNVTL